MNPPAALHGAMSRDRKPFTYTPGGLDLSEIKSQRMAQRLMRNAMNQGVPEVPVQPVHSPSNTSAPVALPNYNCLPVQVFPTFNLPANPKSLLRTRSNPDPRDTSVQKVVPPPFVNNVRVESNNTFNKNTPTYPQVNNNRPVSMYEYNTPPVNAYSIPRTNYGSDGYTAPVLPEISYDAEYFRAPPKVYSETEFLPKVEINQQKDIVPTIPADNVETSLDLTIKPLAEVTIPTISSTFLESKPTEESTAGTDNEQKEVKVVKKQVKKENKVEEQNGNQNGDANSEAEMTVKLPTKKSGAKTETKVEVVKRTLPDGSVEEVKTTITKTTIDGRTEIKTKTETTIIPKEEESEEEVEEEEEDGEIVQEEQEEQTVEEPETTTVTTIVAKPKENGESTIVKTEERSESTTTTKKVVVVEESPKEKQSIETEEAEAEEEEEVEEKVEEAEPVTIVLKKESTPKPTTLEIEPEAADEVEEEETIEEKDSVVVEERVVTNEVKKEVEVEDDEEEVEEEVTKQEEVKTTTKDVQEEVEEEEEYEEAEEKEETEVKVEQEIEATETVEKAEKPELVKENTKEEAEQEQQVEPEKSADEPKETPKEPDEKVIKVEVQAPEVPKPEPKEEKPQLAPQNEFKIPIREPSVPLEKVEDVEIKPIGITPIISKTHTENTEIIRSTIDPSSGLSTQTEYNKIENIVTVNRTTKILDHSYENLTQQGIPTVKTYFPPPSIERISSSPMPSRPYQPVYPPTSLEPTTERRHSLLLERLSMERQMPSDILQYGNQAYDQTQSEPQSEVLTVSNVKPSMITNQQWYQQKNQQQNVIYNNTTSTPTPTGQPWTQPKSQPQPQQQYINTPSPQPQYQPQQQYQPPPQQPQYQQSLTPQTQYQPSFKDPTPERAPSSYSTYTPTPTWVSNTLESQNTTQSSPYSYSNRDTTESYQKSTQQYSSSYVPPPWEQDSNYTSVNNTSTSYFAPALLPQTQSFSPAPTAGWKPPPAKFTKPAPIAYIPPAPNQSFVRSASVSEPPRNTPGRKTYYSEYERRYISVPESTYIPTETKYQPQPDPSPQYYYDNNEPTESVEPQWRRELREFTEKTSQTTTTEHTTTVQPPWEADTKYAKTPSSTYTPTPTWSQTLRPSSYRERSFESEYVSQEWPKTNTLGRGRPLSTLGKSTEAPIPERTRGVSVDRYNPNNYQSPAEHPPVPTHTLTTPAPHAGYHNPNVPAYHTRASVEPREQPTSYQPRVHREARASPLQSRSFKYLQWITGTDD